MVKKVDVAIIGGGTGGYIAAIVAAQAGKSVVVIERDKLGGTCLHQGCIPSKVLLKSANIYRQMKQAHSFGVEAEGITLQFDRVQARKRKIVAQLYRGVQYLMDKNKIEIISGHGRLMGPSIFSPKSGAVAVESQTKETTMIVAQHVIIATGSRPRLFPGLPLNNNIVTTDEALQWTVLPRRVAIIGGGVIGMEWASMLADFGTEVHVFESGALMIPQEDEEISAELQRQLTARGVTFYLAAQVDPEKVQMKQETNEIEVQTMVCGEKITITVDKLLICIGRQANIEQLGLENAGVDCAAERIIVNSLMQTNEPHIYAIGDVIGGAQLAHAAAAEAVTAVRHLCGQHSLPLDVKQIPRCIYSFPETAAIGWNEAEAIAAGYQVKTSKVSFQAIGKAVIQGETAGFVKVVADAQTNDLLGVHIVGLEATELIGEAAVAQLLAATPWEMGAVIHPHPSVSEILGEAMLAIDGRALHI